MSDQKNGGIVWTNQTWNPLRGCTRVSQGCVNCYAERDAHRFGSAEWGHGKPRRYFGDKHWNEPLKWNRKAAEEQAIDPSAQWRVFCASMADVFDNEVAQEHRDRLWALIEATPNLTWLVLTKRIGNLYKMVPMHWLVRMPKNVWLGISVVNQEEADRDIPKLLQIKAHVRWLSMEPLLGPVVLRFTNGLVNGCDAADYLLDWVVVGGESGPGARPMHPYWVQSLRNECAKVGVPFLFKQWGEWCWAKDIPDEYDGKPKEQWMRADGTLAQLDEAVDFFGGDEVMYRVGVDTAGRKLDGVLHNGYPAVKP